MAKEEVEYNEGTSEDWLRAVESVGWNSITEGRRGRSSVVGYRLEGVCHRCKHQFDAEVRYATVIARAATTSADATRGAQAPGDMQKLRGTEAYVACNCSVAHPNRPAGARGCGYAGYIACKEPSAAPASAATPPPGNKDQAPPASTTLVSGDDPHSNDAAADQSTPSTARPPDLPRPAYPVDRRWQARSDDLDFNALAHIRSTAEKWTGSISALTGLFAIAAVFKGRSDIEKLEGDWRAVIAMAGGGALILAIIAIVRAALAAQGQPKRLLVGTTAIRSFYEKEIKDAGGGLNDSRWFAVLAVGLLGIAAGLTWFAPPAAPAAAKAVVESRSGQIACGTLAIGEGGSVTVKNDDGVPQTFAPAEIAGITPKTRCPE
jgi:hypothetical protein